MYEKLLHKNKYQVFLFTCPASVPFVFARHPWFVVNQKGKVSRWEILHETNRCKSSWQHLHKNLFPTFSGIEVFANNGRWLWKPRLEGFIEGDNTSAAAKMASFIVNSHKNYPLYSYYRYPGPNSSTYGQWILNNFPDFKAKLPFNAIGKKYKIK